MSNIRNINYWSFILSVSIMAGLSACDRNYERVFHESPDERVREALNEYNELLVDAPYGWKATLYTGTGGGYFYYFDFNDDGTVTMLSDFNATTAGQSMEGTWVLKALQRPTLSFDTYSYIHMPADPDGNVNGGSDGEGLVSDFEFYFSEEIGDSLILQGIENGSQIVFVKTTEAEAQAIQDKKIQEIYTNTTQFMASGSSLRVSLPDGTEIPVIISIPQKVAGFQYLDDNGEDIMIKGAAFTFSLNGIILKEPLQIKGYSVRELIWDETSEAYYVNFDGPAMITATDEPFFFYPNTPLHESLGYKYSAVLIPEGVGTHPFSGQSQGFTDAYNEAAQKLIEGEYRLTLREIKFIFVPATHYMYMDVTITQENNGTTSSFLAEYGYTYELMEGGVYKFFFEGADQNGWTLFENFSDILSHFDNDTFTTGYIGGDFYLVSGFFSQEDPDYSYAGYLIN